MIKIAHIVNIASFDPTHELHRAQRITLNSLLIAKENAKESVEIELFSANYLEDEHLVPKGFLKTVALERSFNTDKAFQDHRKLPYLKDILDRLFESSDADYFIYSNIDIGVMPNFYLLIEDLIQQNYDSIIINRRRITSDFLDKPLPIIYAEVGKEHIGYDCFIFRRINYPKFLIDDVAIGIPHFCNLLAHNLICFSDNFLLCTDKHVTFHIGMELVKEWGNKKQIKHNFIIYRSAAKKLIKQTHISNYPGSNRWILSRHFKWLMNPNVPYPYIALLDLKHLGVKRRARKKYRPKLHNRYLEWLIQKIRLN